MQWNRPVPKAVVSSVLHFVWIGRSTGMGITWSWCVKYKQVSVQTDLGRLVTALRMSWLHGLKISFESLNLCSHLFEVAIAYKLS